VAIVQQTAASSTSTAASATVSVTVSSGSDLRMMASVALTQAGTLGAHSFNGDSMGSPVAEVTHVDVNTARPRLAIYTLDNPDVGTFDFSSAATGTDDRIFGAVAFSGVDSLRTAATDAGTAGTNQTVSDVAVTSAVGDVVFGAVSLQNLSALSVLDATDEIAEVWEAELGAISTNVATFDGDASSTTVAWAHESRRSVVAAVAMVPAAAATTHATSGVLVGSGSTVDGTAAHIAIHATSGDLVGPGSTLTGTATNFTIHATSGALTGPGAVVEGTAARSGTTEHATSGALVGPGAVLDGTAAHIAVHATSGVLVGQASVLEAVAAHLVTHETSGILVGQGSRVTGSAVNGTFVATTPGGVKKKPQSRFLRRSSKDVPRLPWELDDEPEITIAPPKRKRIQLPPAKVREALGPIPIQTVREISAPVITIPSVGTAVLDDDDDDELLWLI
jgi:hypothetical protein